MSAVLAHLLERDSGAHREVRIEAAPDGVAVAVEASEEASGKPLLSRMRSNGSVLYLADGTRCMVEDTKALDTVLAEARIKRRMREQSVFSHVGWQCAVLLLLLLAALATASYRWIAPQVAASMVDGVSSRMLRAASDKVLLQLDKGWLSPSKLDEAQQNAVRARFATLRLAAGQGVAWRVVFREGGRAGATAFSLPNGDIIVTDELVSLVASDEAAVAVLAHQFAHLQRRDAMLSLALRAPLLVLRAWSWSDKNASLLATGLLDTPVDELAGKEADQFAERLLLANGIAPGVLAHVRRQLAAQAPRGNLPVLLAGY